MTTIPSSPEDKVRIAFPESHRTWILDAQVLMHGAKPDFVLSSTNPQDGKIAIFTDGFAFHASSAHNRIADDAAKRQALRDQGVNVLAITSADLDDWQARHGEGAPHSAERPTWMMDAVTQQLMSGANFNNADIDAFVGGPIEFLVAWMHDPRIDHRRGLADKAGYYFLPQAQSRYAVDADASLEDVLATTLRSGAMPPETAPQRRWLWRTGACALNAEATDGGNLRIVLALDDRAASVSDTAFKSAWQEWLRLSNLFGMRDHSTVITALSLLDTTPPGQAPSTASPAEPASQLEAAWRDALDLCADDQERDVVTIASSIPGAEPPELGLELFDGEVVVVAWPKHKVAVDLDFDANVRDRLKNDGWNVVAPESKALASALIDGGQ